MSWTAYGLTFTSSDVTFPELPAADEAPQPESTVEVAVGKVPEHLVNPGSSGVLYEASGEEFLLRVPNVASYLVTRDRIVIEPHPDTSDHEVRVFLLGSGFGALLHLRELLVLHAAAFYVPASDDDRPEGAVLLSGVSGAGKSTLLGEFLRRGYQMIVDDVCAIDLTDGAEDAAAVVLPGYPRTRLWADAAARLGVDTEPLVRTRPTIEKFERQLPAQFHPRPTRFHRLYVLGTGAEDEPTITHLSATEGFAAILSNTYRRTFLEGLEMREAHFRLGSASARQAAVVELARGRGGFDVAGLADLIEDDLGLSAVVPPAVR